MVSDMRFHFGLSLRPKQILGFLAAAGAAVAALFAGGVIK